MIANSVPPLNTLRAFEAAARHGSFVKASAELHVTPAAVSQRIKDLESSLGTALFERLPRGVELTEAGRRYRDELSRAFAIIERATAQIDQATVAGPLTVSAPESFAQYWLAPRLPRLAARIPGLELTLESESRLVNLRDGQADVGVRFGMGEYPGLDSQWLFGDAATVLVSARSMQELTDARAKTILRSSVLLEDYRTGPDEPWMRWPPWIREAGLRNAAGLRKLRVSDSGLAIAACRASAGACIGRMSLVHELVREHELYPLLPWRSTEFAYYFVTRPTHKNNPRVLAFRSWLAEEVSAYIELTNRHTANGSA